MLGEIFWGIVRWSFILSWRFFTGAHMDGEKHSDATFFYNATRRYQKMQQTNGAWKCMSRWRRMKWRNGVFWPVLFIGMGFMWMPMGTFFILGMIAPGLLLIFWGRIKPVFWNPMVGHHSDGSVTQEWHLKPKYRRLLHKVNRPKDMRKRPGLALESELKPADVEAEELQPNRGKIIRTELDVRKFPELRLLMVPDDDEEEG